MQMHNHTNAEGINMFEKLKRFWKSLWRKDLKPAEQCMTEVIQALQKEEIMSRAPKIPPTYKPMETTPKFKNKVIRNTIPELNKKRNRESTYAHAKHFKRRQPTTARKLWNPRAHPEEEERD
jgi:hypothetical protein